jgi:hypothetical protein
MHCSHRGIREIVATVVLELAASWLYIYWSVVPLAYYSSIALAVKLTMRRLSLIPCADTLKCTLITALTYDRPYDRIRGEDRKELVSWC